MTSVDITFTGLAELMEKLQTLPDTLNASLTDTAQSLASELAQNVRDGALSGQVLNEKTGTLKSSIESSVEESPSGPSASVFVAGDVPYAAILEYGGETKAHVIEATNAKALAFSFMGKASFFAHVNHPGSVIAEHSYLGSTLEAMQDEITSEFTDALADIFAE